MAILWKDNEFKIGINMAGAVSAGAYTAGVLDFLTEALEEWQKAKDAFRAHLSDPGAMPDFNRPVPLHDVSIEAFSGASAGGMCAAIASVMLQSEFEHITDPNAQSTTNTFYEAWVNQIDIRKLLQSDDVKGGKPLVSLLDSTIIDEIAAGALKPPANPISRPYVADRLSIFLTLTNVRGMTYPLYDDGSGQVSEYTTYYGDRIRFETLRGGVAPSSRDAYGLLIEKPEDAGWKILQESAKSTGAFPLFLAPRTLTRRVADYQPPIWFPVGSDVPVPLPLPDLPKDVETIQTLNVDGGVTDNDPFELVHDYLAASNPLVKTVNGVKHNPRLPQEANCAVITVAPFPTKDRFNPDFFAKPMTLFGMLGRLFSITMSQSRFLGESLSVLLSGSSFSRFVIAPSDPGQTDDNALQCATLSAFGGFMERKFRAHDFLLGRYNCQRFLSTHFMLPVINPVIDAGMKEAGEYVGSVNARFVTGPPPGTDATVPATEDDNAPATVSVPKWMPVIPLLGTAAVDMTSPVRQQISKDDVHMIAGLVMERLRAIKDPLLANVPAGDLLKAVVNVVTAFERGKVADLLTTQLCPNVEGQQPGDCKK